MFLLIEIYFNFIIYCFYFYGKQTDSVRIKLLEKIKNINRKHNQEAYSKENNNIT